MFGLFNKRQSKFYITRCNKIHLPAGAGIYILVQRLHLENNDSVGFSRLSVIGRERYGHYDVLIAGEVGPYLAYIAFGKSNLVYGSAVFVSGKRGVAVNGEDKVFKVFVYRLFIDVVAKSLRVVFGNNKKTANASPPC